MVFPACHSSGRVSVRRIAAKAAIEMAEERCTFGEIGHWWLGSEHFRYMTGGFQVRSCCRKSRTRVERASGSSIVASCQRSCGSHHAARLGTIQDMSCCSPLIALLGTYPPALWMSETLACSSSRKREQRNPDMSRWEAVSTEFQAWHCTEQLGQHRSSPLERTYRGTVRRQSTARVVPAGRLRPWSTSSVGERRFVRRLRSARSPRLVHGSSA